MLTEHSQDPGSLIAALQDALPEGEVLVDATSCRLYAQDVYTRGAPAGVVLRPDNIGELQTAMSVLHRFAVSCLPHGGGLSYTGGVVPGDSNWAVIDLGRMQRVLEINRKDMTVTVECGCTWKLLHEALEGSGLRTAYWGTLSGIRATVGGGLSDNAIFWGSGHHGTAVDAILSLSVVLADGTRIDTGSAAQRNATPFYRHFGPDLTGLFCADSGALGIKATATFRLVPVSPAQAYLAFDFPTAEGTLGAMSDIARAGVASECFGFDPFLQGQRMKRESIGADIKALTGVLKASDSVLGAVKDGARIALAGRRYMDDVEFSVQVIIEDRIAAGAEDRARTVREIAAQHGGREIENSIPKIARANPFGPVNSMLGPEGERWLPVHGLFPHSRYLDAYAATEAIFEKHRARSEALGVGIGYLFATVSTHVCVLEPVFYWPDEIQEIHAAAVDSAHLAKLPRHPANPEAREHVHQLRNALIDCYSELGAAHLQIGRSYRYRDALKDGPARLIDALKEALDADGRMNPGSLGLPAQR